MNLETIYNHFATSKHGYWIMVPDNVRALYKFVRENKVKKMLDLGTGIGVSASVMSLALKDGGRDGHIDSIEQFDKCVKIANEMIPKELMENITIHQVNAEAWEYEKIPYTYFSIYETLPKEDYDLIVVDGPGLWEEGDAVADMPNGDIIKLLIEERIKPGTFIIWDGRLAALKILEKYYGDNFYMIRAPESIKDDFFVLERKNNKVHFFDARREGIQEMGYFSDDGPKKKISNPKAGNQQAYNM